MRVVVTDFYTGGDRVFDGPEETVVADLLAVYGHMLRLWPKKDDISHIIAGINHQQNLVAEASEDNLAKSEEQVLMAMLGVQKQLLEALSAARFLSGQTPVGSLVREALWQADGDAEHAALVACKLEPTDENRKALRAVMGLQDMRKAEAPIDDKTEITEAHPEGRAVAESVRRAAHDSAVTEVRLSGRHSKGAMVAVDQETSSRWLLKPGSGGQSSASGAKEDGSSQSQREAAFYQVASLWHLAQDIPRTELLIVDSEQVAAIKLLDPSFSPIDARRAADESAPMRIFAPYRHNGQLHQWAVLDAVLGNTDRHAQNIMVNDAGVVQLIDHGSAFAGRQFDPATDGKTFTPFYLRYSTPRTLNFNTLDPKQKLRYMELGTDTSRELVRTWLLGLDVGMLASTLVRYGIDPRPSVDRLQQLMGLASLVGPIDLAINRWWVEV